MTEQAHHEAQHGLVFNIQHYSLHDGPGIRTLVFLKGCPLRCRWCSNPESQRMEPELVYNSDKCIGKDECLLCVRSCPTGALRAGDNGVVRIDRGVCRECFTCAEVCPSQAIRVFGRRMGVEQVLLEVEADGLFHARSGGGMTLSGGEPLAQADFACELLRQAKQRRINTSLETCGHCAWNDLERACRSLDSILFDIKTIDPQKHREFTSASNVRILENFLNLCERFPDLPKLVRTPVIPGFNDSQEEIGAIADFVRNRPGVQYQLLPYHRFGQPKYRYLDRVYPLPDAVLDDGRMKALQQFVKTRMAGGQ